MLPCFHGCGWRVVGCLGTLLGSCLQLGVAMWLSSYQLNKQIWWVLVWDQYLKQHGFKLICLSTRTHFNPTSTQRPRWETIRVKKMWIPECVMEQGRLLTGLFVACSRRMPHVFGCLSSQGVRCSDMALSSHYVHWTGKVFLREIIELDTRLLLVFRFISKSVNYRYTEKKLQLIGS